jgi:hypothetical protein
LTMKMMVSCTEQSSQRVPRTPMPKEFKLPNDRQMFDGLHELESWLADYL